MNPYPHSNQSKWSKGIIIVHWLTVAIIVSVFSLVFARDYTEDQILRQSLMQWHRWAGLTAWWLLLARIPARLASSDPKHDLPALLKWASLGGHFLLYGLLIAMPVLGYLVTCAHAGHVDYFGIQLPTLMARDRDLADVLGDIHTTLGWLMLALIGSHATAALWHHHIRRDGVLRAMLP